MELELDFSDHEELEFADRSELEAIARQIEQVIHHLVDTFSVGNASRTECPWPSWAKQTPENQPC